MRSIGFAIQARPVSRPATPTMSDWQEALKTASNQRDMLATIMARIAKGELSHPQAAAKEALRDAGLAHRLA